MNNLAKNLIFTTVVSLSSSQIGAVLEEKSQIQPFQPSGQSGDSSLSSSSANADQQNWPIKSAHLDSLLKYNLIPFVGAYGQQLDGALNLLSADFLSPSFSGKTFQQELDEATKAHRPFWVVRVTDENNKTYYFSADNFNRYLFGDNNSQSYKTLTLPHNWDVKSFISGQVYQSYQLCGKSYKSVFVRLQNNDSENFQTITIPGTDEVLDKSKVEYFKYEDEVISDMLLGLDIFHNPGPRAKLKFVKKGSLTDLLDNDSNLEGLELKALLQNRSVGSFECFMLSCRVKAHDIYWKYREVVSDLPWPCRKVLCTIERCIPSSLWGKAAAVVSAGAVLYAITHRHAVAQLISTLVSHKLFAGGSAAVHSMTQPIVSRIGALAWRCAA